MTRRDLLTSLERRQREQAQIAKGHRDLAKAMARPGYQRMVRVAEAFSSIWRRELAELEAKQLTELSLANEQEVFPLVNRRAERA